MSMKLVLRSLERLHEKDSLNYLVTLRKKELQDKVNNKELSESTFNDFIRLQARVHKYLSINLPHNELIDIFYALRLDYFLKDPENLTKKDLYDYIKADEALFQRRYQKKDLTD